MPRHMHRPPHAHGGPHGHPLPHERPHHLHDHEPPHEPPLHHGHVPPHLRHAPPHEALEGAYPGPLPPHLVRELAAGLFGSRERAALGRLFEDVETAERVYQVLQHAPPEFALLAAVLLRSHERACAG